MLDQQQAHRRTIGFPVDTFCHGDEFLKDKSWKDCERFVVSAGCETAAKKGCMAKIKLELTRNGDQL
jgi:hypothetical protein